VNGGLTTAQYQAVNRVVICPNGAVYVGKIDDSPSVDAFLARAPYVGGVFSIIEDQASIDVKTGVGDSHIVNFNCNQMVGESVVYVLGSSAEICKLYIGAGSTFAAGATFSYLGAEGDITFGANKWLLTGQLWIAGPTGRFFIISANAMTKISDAALDNYQNNKHVRAGTTGRTLHYLGAGSSLTLGTDNCATLVPSVAAGAIDNMQDFVDVLGADVTLTYLMGWGNGSRRGKSSDGGYSWSTMGNLPVLVNFYYCCVDAARWIAVGSYVYYSNDFGNTVWKNKQGNLASINPLFVLDVVKVVP
jgi:hypothetical protein